MPGQVSLACIHVESAFDELDHIGAILVARRLQLHINERRSLDHRTGLGIKCGRQKVLTRLGAHEIDRDAIDLERYAGAKRDQTSGVPLERFIAHEKIHVFGGPREPIRADGEGADDHMTNP